MGTKTRMTVNGSGNLQLDEGAEWGSYETSPKDYGAGQNRIRRVQALLVVVENPEGAGAMKSQLQLAISTDGAAYSDWLPYSAGEYTFRAVKYLVTVWGDPKAGQRPEITRFSTTEIPADRLGWAGSVISTQDDAPATVLLGERYLVSASPTPAGAFDQHANEIAIVVEPTDKAFRFQELPAGAVLYHVGDDELKRMSAAGTVTAADLANLPTDGEKAALPGTSGTPSGSNKYVTNSDPRLPGAGEIVASSAELTLTTAYQDIAGLTKTFTPSTDGRALVVASLQVRNSARTAMNNYFVQALQGAGVLQEMTVTCNVVAESLCVTVIGLATLVAAIATTIKIQAKKSTADNTMFAGSYGKMAIVMIPALNL